VSGEYCKKGCPVKLGKEPKAVLGERKEERLRVIPFAPEKFGKEITLFLKR